MSIWLAPHVHASVIGSDVVLLDIETDRYLCLRAAAAELCLTPDRRGARPADAELALMLVEAGLAVEAGVGASVEGSLGSPPTAGVDPTSIDRITVRDTLRLFASLLDLALHYRGRTFQQILAFASRPPKRRHPDDKDAIVRLAKIFQRHAVWLPMPGKCLVRCFVLLRFLQRSGYGCRWVFGVEVWPFAAHCWLQAGHVALDDAPERLVGYTPILSVEG